MSVAAVMLVRDEADIIGDTISYLLEQVDAVYVNDNRSCDGSSEILRSFNGAVVVNDDREIGYWQSRKTTGLARQAGEDGHDWVIPVDADERWEVPSGARLADYLAGVALDVQVIRAAITNHVPTGGDPPTGSVFERIGWRQPQPQTLGKVAARTHPKLTIQAGNHSADYGRLRFLEVDGLRIRHYPWRNEEQYLLKIRNGQEAYAATNLPATTGAHWRMWEGADDDAIREWFQEWGYEETPPGRHDLIYDPAVSCST